MTEADENLRKVEKAYAGFFSGDLDAFFEHFDDNGEIIEASSLPYGGVYKGRAEATRALMLIQQAWDDISIDFECFLPGPNIVAAIGQMRGKARSGGAALDMPLIELWRFDQGRVMSISPIYGDTHLALAILGQGGGAASLAAS